MELWEIQTDQTTILWFIYVHLFMYISTQSKDFKAFEFILIKPPVRYNLLICLKNIFNHNEKYHIYLFYFFVETHPLYRHINWCDPKNSNKKVHSISNDV